MWSEPKKNEIQFEGVSQEILRETSSKLSPEERDRLRREREVEGMMEFYGSGRLNDMMSYLKSNSINKIRSREIYLDLEIDQILPMDDQPRKYFDQEALDDLKASIEEKGLSTPILVRRVGEKFRIIAGERRWRAFRELGHKKIPAIIKEVKDEKEAYILAAIENLQRENLNVIEEALCYHKMLEGGVVGSQKDLAKIVGRNKSRISERLSLLKLPDPVKDLLGKKEAILTEGHALEILRLKNPSQMINLAERVVNEKLSRDQLRQEVNLKLNPKKGEEVESAEATPLIPEVTPEPVKTAAKEAAINPAKELAASQKFTDIPGKLAAVIDDEVAKTLGEIKIKSPLLDGTLAIPLPAVKAETALIFPSTDPTTTIRFIPDSEHGFDLLYHYRPNLKRHDALQDVIKDMSSRLRVLKKLRKRLRKAGVPY